jgi:hypothetical protein
VRGFEIAEFSEVEAVVIVERDEQGVVAAEDVLLNPDGILI